MKRPLGLALSLVLTLSLSYGGPASAVDWTTKVDASVLQAAALGDTEFIAYIVAKADLSAAATFMAKVDKGRYVHEALTETARTSQAGLLTHLATLGAAYRSYWITNAVHVSGGLSVLSSVASRPDVKAVFAVGKGRLEAPVSDVPGGTEVADLTTSVGPSVGWVKADHVWALGYRGQGAVVANADTGVRWTHNALKKKYRGYDAASGAVSHDHNWHDAIKNPNTGCPTAGGSPQPCDDDVAPLIGGGGHGTHTMGTMVGDDGAGNQIGMAPDAKWVACRNMNNGLGVVPTYMDCMQWFIAPTRIDGTGADPSKAPDVVSNSWGCVEVCAPPLLKDMIDASRAAGIFYVVSAGNEGQWTGPKCDTIVWPLAVYDAAFTVGATNATNDGSARFSSRGPVPDNVIEGFLYRKPDIVAPGVGIRSSLRGSDTAYGSLSGTSMSGPHVAGLVALIISANPTLRGHVDTIEDVIRKSAVKLTTTAGCGGDTSTQVPNNVFGWGRIDALAAVQLALTTTPTAPFTRETVGLPAQVVSVQKETGLQQHPTEDFTGSQPRTGTTTWRVVKDTGNCCENHVTASREGRLFDIGGSYVNYTDDRGVTWSSVRPLDPLFNGEGSMAMAPNGDVIGMTWDAYTGDHFLAYKFNADTGKWSTLTNPLHQPFYDRPWLTVVPGPFKDPAGKTVPYISIVRGGPQEFAKDPMWISYDGLLYRDASSRSLDNVTSGAVDGWFPIAADASFDWIQPIRRAPVTGLGGGHAIGDGGFRFDPDGLWHRWRLPDGSVPPTYIQIDSAGRIHHVRSAGAGALEYRISANGGQSWTAAVIPVPFGGLTDFKVNKAAGVSALALRMSDQDWVYKFDISGDTAKLMRRYRVGKGDVPAGSSIGALTNPRMDFQTIAIFADGRVAVSFLDSSTFSHPPGTGMLGRYTPALAIELDTLLPEPIVGTKATGGGWLASVEGDKINFGFQAEQTATGPTGDLSLNDHKAKVKVAMTTLTWVGPLTSACGNVPASATTVEIAGSGTLNGSSATFRACVQDNGPKSGNTPTGDLFYLECLSGCDYRTSGRAPDAAIDAGNIDAFVPASDASAPAASTAVPSTMILDPLLLTELGTGAGQTFTVRVFGSDQRPLANASVTILTVTAAGSTSVTALSDLSGKAIVLLTGLATSAEYIATSGSAESNAIQLAPPLLQ